MSDTLTFNGRNFSEFGVFFDGSKSFLTPEKDIEFVEIPGRNGSLSFDNKRFNDLTVPYPCFIRGSFLSKFREFEQFLYSTSGYQKLECSKEPNHFRMAQFVSVIEPRTTAFNKSGFFDINFRCHPQRYLKSGDTYTLVSVSSTVTNPTLFPSYPLLRIVGTGFVSIGNVTITITEHPYERIYFDCETLNAYYGAHNCNQYVTVSTHERISLSPGANGFDYTVGELRIKPRWYEI